jgi:hypothetical protein
VSHRQEDRRVAERVGDHGQGHERLAEGGPGRLPIVGSALEGPVYPRPVGRDRHRAAPRRSRR